MSIPTYRCLRGAVDRQGLLRRVRRGAGRDDDAPAHALLAHVAHCDPHDVDGAAEVHINDFVLRLRELAVRVQAVV